MKTIIPDKKTCSVLSIAGFDNSGGAGIQADIKTISSLGCYATSVLTALPIQNTQGVRGLFHIPATVVTEQLQAVFEDIYPDAVKIGMVYSIEIIEQLVSFLKDYKGSVIFDPVMTASSGHSLMQKEIAEACIKHLFPLVTLVTPNLNEAGILIGQPVSTENEMQVAGKQILEMGSQAVLMKGGHLSQPVLTSYLIQHHKAPVTFTSHKVDTQNTHGSGCTLSSAIASYLAQQFSLEQSVEAALSYTHQAIMEGAQLQIGKGSGPLNHFFNPQKLITYPL